MRSATARAILAGTGVEIGTWTYGSCFSIGSFSPGTRIGRYVSIAPGVRQHGRNHPLKRKSLHPLFYNAALGTVAEDQIEFTRCEIGHDAWLGQNAIITPRVSRIGIGAVVAAGSVVTRDVPDFAIVAGNPAKILRFRFEEPTRQRILDSAWWESDRATLERDLPSFLEDVVD